MTSEDSDLEQAVARLERLKSKHMKRGGGLPFGLRPIHFFEPAVYNFPQILNTEAFVELSPTKEEQKIYEALQGDWIACPTQLSAEIEYSVPRGEKLESDKHQAESYKLWKEEAKLEAEDFLRKEILSQERRDVVVYQSESISNPNITLVGGQKPIKGRLNPFGANTYRLTSPFKIEYRLFYLNPKP